MATNRSLNDLLFLFREGQPAKSVGSDDFRDAIVSLHPETGTFNGLPTSNAGLARGRVWLNGDTLQLISSAIPGIVSARFDGRAAGAITARGRMRQSVRASLGATPSLRAAAEIATVALFYEPFDVWSYYDQFGATGTGNWYPVAYWAPNNGGDLVGQTWRLNPFNPATPISGTYAVSGGQLNLLIQNTPAPYSAACGYAPYVSGQVVKPSAANWGLFECRMSVPAIPGTNSSFYLISNDGAGKVTEVNVEIVSGSGWSPTQQYQFAIIGPYRPEYGYEGGVWVWHSYDAGGIVVDATQMHTYAFDMRPDYVTCLIDGVQCLRVATPAGFGVNPWDIYIGHGSGGDWTGPIPGGQVFTPMKIDYVRVTEGDLGVQAIPANTFLNSTGIGTHIDQGYGATGATSYYIAELQYTGFRNFRTGVGQLATVQAVCSATGAKALINCHATAIASTVTFLKTLANAGQLLALEGINEANNFAITYNGQTGGGTGDWLPVAQYMRDLYAAKAADLVLRNYPLFSATEAGAQTTNSGIQWLTTPAGSGCQIGDNVQLADYVNVHNYVHGNPDGSGNHFHVDNQAWACADGTGGGLAFNTVQGNFTGTTWYQHYTCYPTSMSNTIPRVTTETGWDGDNAQTPNNSLAVQGKMITNCLLAQFKRGFSYTFIYEMIDAEASGENQGLYTANPTRAAKPAADYMHNLTTILADTTDFTTSKLNYSIPSQPSTVHDLLLQKASGKFYLVVWGERVTGSDAITVNFGRTFDNVNVYDITLGTTPVSSYANVSSVNLTVTDHALIIEAPASSAMLGAYLGTPGDSGSPWQADLTAVQTTFGQSPAIVNAYTADSSWTDAVNTAAWAASIWPRSTIPSVTAIDLGIPAAVTSLAGDAASITNGSHDTDYINMIQPWIDAGFKTIYARIGWEMNLTGWKWTVTAGGSAFTTFNSVFQHIADLIHNHSWGAGVSVKTVWAPGHVGNPGADGLTYTEFFPGPDYVDVVGIDSYAGPGIALSTQPLDTGNYSIRTMLQLAGSLNKPVAMGEHGATISYVPTFAPNVTKAFKDYLPGIVPLFGSITDAYGNVWQIVATSGGQPNAVTINGNYGNGYNVASLTLYQGTVYQVNTSGAWYSYTPTGTISSGVAATLPWTWIGSTSPLPSNTGANHPSLLYVNFWTEAIGGDGAGSMSDSTARAAWNTEWINIRG